MCFCLQKYKKYSRPENLFIAECYNFRGVLTFAFCYMFDFVCFSEKNDVTLLKNMS